MAAAFVLDRQSILDRLGGDEEIYRMMVDMFLSDVDNNCTSLAGAFSAGDSAATFREVHTIKGLLATFSDDVGAAEAFSIEQLAKKGQLDGLAARIGSLQARLREVAAILRGG